MMDRLRVVMVLLRREAEQNASDSDYDEEALVDEAQPEVAQPEETQLMDDDDDEESPLLREARQCVKNACDPRELAEVQEELRVATELADGGTEFDADELLTRTRISVDHAMGRRHVDLLSAYNVGVFLQKYMGRLDCTLTKAVRDIDRPGLSRTTAGVYESFAKVIDDVPGGDNDVRVFLYTCQERWSVVRGFLKQNTPRQGVLEGNCPLWTAFTENWEAGESDDEEDDE